MQKINKLNKIIYFFITAIFLISFNLYCSGYLSKLSQEKVFFLPGIDLNYMENTGAAFSILQDYKMLLIIFSIIAIVGIIWYLVKHISDLSMMTIFIISILLSGITCNLYERITLGFVRDYFEFTFVNFPIFNISDVFINVSVVVIMFMLLTKNYSKK